VVFIFGVITVDKVAKSKHNKILLGYKESKERQHVSALLFYKVGKSKHNKHY